MMTIAGGTSSAHTAGAVLIKAAASHVTRLKKYATGFTGDIMG